MSVTTAQVKALRERTNAGIMDAKRALEEAGGDMEAAVVILRKKGMDSAAKKGDREASQGLIFQYVHSGRIGVLLELNCETDFVARNETFQDLGRNIGQHIVGMAPKYINAEDVPADEREQERKVHDGSDVEVDRKIVLMAQPFVRNPKVTIGEMVQEAIGILKENIVIRRFTRYELGENLSNASAADDGE